MKHTFNQGNTGINGFQNVSDVLKIPIFLVIMFVSGGLFSGLGFLLCIPLFDFPLDLATLTSNVLKDVRAEIVVQIFSALGAFVVPALVYAKIFEGKPAEFLKIKKLPSFKIIIFTAVLFFLANFVLDVLVKATHLIPFEQFDIAFIKNLLETEKLTELAFKRFLNFTSPLYFILVFVMMAILPALGEELTFRGVFYNLFNRSSGKPAFAIIFSAFIFAMIHFQLHNFLAIFFMGALLAYVYYISENLWVSVAAHLFNNGLIVVLSYASKLGYISYDFSKTDDMPLIISIFGATIFLVFFYFYRLWILKEKNTNYE